MTFTEVPNKPVFYNCNQEIQIFVPQNYPYDQFCGRTVSKILPPYYKIEPTEYICRCLITRDVIFSVYVYVMIDEE